MSETVRNYSRGSVASRRWRGGRKRGVGLAKFLLPLLIVAAACFFWITRDNHPMESFISRDRSYEAYINNIVNRRRDVFSSSVWRLLPEDSQVRLIMDRVGGDLPVPEWLLNNLSAGLCHISGVNSEFPGGVLAATRMTRIGCLAERMARLLPGVKNDYTGGLGLHHISDAGLFYAVRGRTLLLTASRDRLIHALTLAEADALSRQEFEDGIRMAGSADVYCRLASKAIAASSPPFKGLDIVVRFEENDARLLIQGDFSQEFVNNYGILFGEESGQPLPAPLDGLVSISLDLGRPLPKYLDALAHVFKDTDIAPAWLWNIFAPSGEDTIITSMQPLISAVVQKSGSRVRLGWFGFDHLEMAPAPLVAAVFEAKTDPILNLYEGIVAPPQKPQEIDLAPRLNREEMTVYVPFVGGANLKPTLAPFERGFILSSSYPLATNIKNSSALKADFNQSGNLFVCIRPREAVESLCNVARELAFSGLLRGYTPDTLEAAIVPWMASASSIRDAVLLASWDGEKLEAQVKISMQPQDEIPVADETKDADQSGKR